MSEIQIQLGEVVLTAEYEIIDGCAEVTYLGMAGIDLFDIMNESAIAEVYRQCDAEIAGDSQDQLDLIREDNRDRAESIRAMK